MSDDDDRDLTEAQRRALRELPAESAVPRGLEDRVVDALRQRGLLSPEKAVSRRASPGLGRLAAAAGLFAAGLSVGLFASRVPASRPPDGSLYLLLLYPGPAYAEGGPADEARRVEEYRSWAGALRREGRLLSAERLDPGAEMVDPVAVVEAAQGPQGFFLVRASDPEQARAIARACPHLRHGGRVAVQAVDPT